MIASAAAALEKFHEVALVMSAKRGQVSQASHASDSAKGGRALDASDESPPKITDQELSEYFVHSSSESDDVLCGPHQDCCGGAVCDGAYTSCGKRLGKGGFQHPRGQVCLSLHKYLQCAACKNVVHSGCWVRTAKGSFMLPSALTPFHCFTCASKKDQQAQVSTNDFTSSTVQPSLVKETDRTRTFMSESELRRHFKASNWTVHHSTDTRLYYSCMSKTCKVKFKAKKGSDDDTWFISNMPTCHSCSASATPQVRTSLVTLKEHLSEALVKEIESLGVTKSFRSKQIQHHLLNQTEPVLVATKLIHNIVYRVRQKLFGQQGDMIYLLEQQKVPFMCLCTQALLPSFVLMLVKGWLR